jgi:hypothetical protein
LQRGLMQTDKNGGLNAYGRSQLVVPH